MKICIGSKLLTANIIHPSTTCTWSRVFYFVVAYYILVAVSLTSRGLLMKHAVLVAIAIYVHC